MPEEFEFQPGGRLLSWKRAEPSLGAWRLRNNELVWNLRDEQKSARIRWLSDQTLEVEFPDGSRGRFERVPPDQNSAGHDKTREVFEFYLGIQR